MGEVPRARRRSTQTGEVEVVDDGARGLDRLRRDVANNTDPPAAEDERGRLRKQPAMRMVPFLG